MSKPILIGGASMPRSGHHYLHRILMSYLGDRFGYCSYYRPWKHDHFETCCRSIPCRGYQTTDFNVFLQKSHDFELTDPVGVADLNLVQIREPIARLFSNFELYLKQQPEENTLHGFKNFARREYYYYVAFWYKWIVRDIANRVILAYAQLRNQPVKSIAMVLKEAGCSVDKRRLTHVIDQQKKSRGGDAKYVSRDVTLHEFYDANWLGDYWRRLRSACPHFTEFFDARTFEP